MRATPAVALVIVLSSSAARADAEPHPVIPVEDVRTQGPVARYAIEPSAAWSHYTGPAGAGNVNLYRFQLGLGPHAVDGQLAEIFGWLARYGLRARWDIVDPSPGSALAGPLTIALDRYHEVAPLDIAPLVHVHAGVEIALASPWLSGRDVIPPPTLRTLDGVDAELAGNGFSLRPLTPYVRLDFLACRSIYFETGGGPEVFVATQPGTPTAYDARFFVGAGFSLACTHARDSIFHHVVLSAEYRGRLLLYAGASPTDYHDMASAGLQIDLGPVTVAGFAAMDPGLSPADYRILGVRLQYGLWATR